MSMAFNADCIKNGEPALDEDPIERQIIVDLIERESAAFLLRDFAEWEKCIFQDDRLRRLGALIGGILDYIEGYSAQAHEMKQMFARHPVPNHESASEYKRTNWSFRISDELAWVSYDQYGPRSPDPFVTAGLSHQIRFLEKQDGKWKIAMLGHGDTTLEYYDYPVIRVDEELNILWMNDSAKSELPTHPSLRKSGARLHAARRADTDTLKAAAQEIGQMGIMDYRPSITNPRGTGIRPILLEDAESEKEHIVWVSKRDDMLLVRFNDLKATESQLEDAQDLFALSPAQTRLAALVLEGLDMPASSKHLGISLNTAKTHLQRLFDKTGTRSQSALVAKLLGITPPQA